MYIWHDENWLREQRSKFVCSSTRNPFTIVRNSLRAGNTGTRIQSGRPQPRFQESLELARAIGRQKPSKGQPVFSLTTMISRAVQSFEKVWI